MPSVPITYGGLAIDCLNFGQEWSINFSIIPRFPTNITSGRSGREGRRPEDEALRFGARVHLVLQDDEAQAFRDALANLGTGFVGLPIWPDRLAGVDWSTRIFDPQAIFDLGMSAIIAGGSTLDPAGTYAPLLVGHIDKFSEISALTAGMAELSFDFIEDSPWEFRVGVNASASAGTWPTALSPNWVSPPLDKPEHGLTFNQVGEQRQRTIENQEIAFRWGQEADFTLADRPTIRTLLAFFVASQGPRKPFTSPWWLHPGTPTSTAPASTTARFAADNLQLDFETDSVVSVKIAVLQLPWEISGVMGETPQQPARVYLYQFKYDLPTPIYSRYTNWPRTLARTSDGTYNPAPVKHQEIAEDISLTQNEVVIESFIFSGNPLGLFVPFYLEARLFLSIFEVETEPIDPDSAVLRWFGEVKKAQQKGRKITATAAFAGGLFDRQLPGVILGTHCATRLFSTACGLLKSDFIETGTLTTNSGNTLTIATSASDAADTFAHGWVEIGSGATWERRAVTSSAPVGGGQQLVVDRAVRQAAAGQAVVFYPGCDLTFAACVAFGNSGRFRGFPNLPQVNLSLPSFAAEAPGKK